MVRNAIIAWLGEASVSSDRTAPATVPNGSTGDSSGTMPLIPLVSDIDIATGSYLGAGEDSDLTTGNLDQLRAAIMMLKARAPIHRNCGATLFLLVNAPEPRPSLEQVQLAWDDFLGDNQALKDHFSAHDLQDVEDMVDGLRATSQSVEVGHLKLVASEFMRLWGERKTLIDARNKEMAKPAALDALGHARMLVGNSGEYVSARRDQRKFTAAMVTALQRRVRHCLEVLNQNVRQGETYGRRAPASSIEDRVSGLSLTADVDTLKCILCSIHSNAFALAAAKLGGSPRKELEALHVGLQKLSESFARDEGSDEGDGSNNDDNGSSSDGQGKAVGR
ncbi:hypothetical protein B0T19DRAFT_418302, partial [Cercophora scortea]